MSTKILSWVFGKGSFSTSMFVAGRDQKLAEQKLWGHPETKTICDLVYRFSVLYHGISIDPCICKLGPLLAGRVGWILEGAFPHKWPRGPPCLIGWSSASQTTTVSPQGNGKSCGAVAVQHDKYDEYGRPNYGETFLSWCGIPASANRDFFLLTCKKPWFCHSCLKGILCFPYTYSWHEILQQTFNMKQSCECSFEQDLIFIRSFSAKIHDSNTTLSPLPVPSLHGSMGATRSYGISRKITKDSEGVSALEEISACNPLPGGVVYGCLWDLGRLGRFFGGGRFLGWERGDGRGGRNIYSDPKYHPGSGRFWGFVSKISLRKIQPENWLEKEDAVRIWCSNPPFFGVHVSNVAWLLMITLLKWKFTRLYPGWTLLIEPHPRWSMYGTFTYTFGLDLC